MNTHVQFRHAPIGLLQVSANQRVPSDSMTIKAHTAMELTPQTYQAYAKQPPQLPSSCTPSPALALAPTEVQQSGKSDPIIPSHSTADSTYTKDTGPPNNTILPSFLLGSFAPSNHSARQSALFDEPTSEKDISQNRKPAKKQVGLRAKKAETGEASSGAMALGFPSLGRADCVLEEPNSSVKDFPQWPDAEIKGKILSTIERKLKDLEKKLHMMEINMSDPMDQNEYSKTYILTMEHKMKELENTNRHLTMKMLQQEEAGIVGNEQNGLATEPTQSNRTRNEPQASVIYMPELLRWNLSSLSRESISWSTTFRQTRTKPVCMRQETISHRHTLPIQVHSAHLYNPIPLCITIQPITDMTLIIITTNTSTLHMRMVICPT